MNPKFFVKSFRVLSAVCCFTLGSCSMFTSGSSSQNIPGETVYWNASESNVFEIKSGVQRVRISGATKGKTLYLVKRNTGDEIIAEENQPYVERVVPRTAAGSAEIEEISQLLKGNSWHCRVPAEIKINTALFNHSAARTAAEPAENDTTENSCTVEQIDPVVGTTSKELYIFNSENKLPVTLYAVGTHCYVWIGNDYYAETPAGDKVNKKTAENIAAKFDLLYGLIRNIFGEESEHIYGIGDDKISIDKASDTGSMVNIVLYDIDGDYEENQKVGTEGYFYGMDYYTEEEVKQLNKIYTITSTTNVGKYLYIDSGFANSSPEQLLGTVAHEFQHMIRSGFCQQNSVYNHTWFNEMMSMLCEDMVQEYVKNKDEFSPKGRTTSFNAFYYICGLNEYNTDDGYDGALCYGVWSSFGLFLARRYGGAELVQKMAKYVEDNENEKIVNSINELNDTQYTFDDLFEQYVQALLGSEEYTHDVDAATTINYNFEDGTTYNYPMTAYNIFDEMFGIWYPEGTYCYSDYDGLGPLIFAADAGRPLRPDNGFTLHGIKTMTSTYTTVTLNSANTDSDLKMYLILL